MSTTPEIKTAPLIEVWSTPVSLMQVINRKVAEQIPRVDVGYDNTKIKQDLRERADFFAYLPALCDVLARLDGKLIRVHWRIFIELDGGAKDQIEARQKQIKELPVVFLK